MRFTHHWQGSPKPTKKEWWSAQSMRVGFVSLGVYFVMLT